MLTITIHQTFANNVLLVLTLFLLLTQCGDSIELSTSII